MDKVIFKFVDGQLRKVDVVENDPHSYVVVEVKDGIPISAHVINEETRRFWATITPRDGSRELTV